MLPNIPLLIANILNSLVGSKNIEKEFEDILRKYPECLKAIPILVDGMTVEEIEKKLSGITCGMRPTSCGDQLAKAVREAYNAELKQN